jgi:hypothetical protein
MSNLSLVQDEGLRSGPDRLADRAHGPVLQISKKQNRELQYASVRRGKPAIGRNYLGPGFMEKTVLDNEFVLVLNLSRNRRNETRNYL